MKEVNLETMNIQELKALAYDIIMAMQRDQQALNQVNEKISKLSQPEKKE